MTTLDIMINAYEALDNNAKEYADKNLPDFDIRYEQNLNHWTNPTNDVEVAMDKTIAEFTMWFNAIANNNYGLRD